MQPQTVNKLILGDNLEILKTMDNDSVDLIYLDPPFFSNRTYEVIWGDKGEVRSFEDRFSGGMDHYIAWLKERVEQMHRILKPTGSIFLHCDWHANAYIRVEILDKLFGSNNFRNEIIWKRKTGRGETNHKSSKFGTETDTIFFYTKSKENYFQSQFSFNVPGYDKYLETSFNLIDENGRKYQSDNLSSPTPRPNLTYEFKGYAPPKNGWAISLEKMEQWDKEGRILYPKSKNGRLRRKRYLDEVEGKPIQNLWLDIEITSQSNERIGYPTQKPIALLNRIIECASKENDVVLDPFIGGGTTIVAADKLNRRWIGIDQSVQAIKVTEFRLNNQQDLFSSPFVTQLHKYDYDTLRNKEAFEFESFIITQFGGTPQNKKGGDKGIDGKTKDGTPIQVKRSDNVSREVIDKILTAAKRFDSALFERNIAERKPIAYIIAFSFGRGAIEEVARCKNKENTIIKLVTVEEIVPITKKPTLKIDIKEVGKDKKDLMELEFVATAESSAGIEFYAWDFAYNEDKGFKPQILIDKEGMQLYKFKAGQHTIAVKVVDNDGLDNIDIIKLKVNGKIERTA